MPETPATLEAQRRAAHDPASSRAGVLYTPGEAPPPLDPNHPEVNIPIPGGQTLRVSEQKFHDYAAQTGVTFDDLASGKADFTPLIGGKAQPNGQVLGATGPAAVVTTDAKGNELVSSAVTDPSAVPAEAALHKKQFPNEQINTTVATPEDVVALRQQGQPEVTPTPQGETTDEDMPGTVTEAKVSDVDEAPGTGDAGLFAADVDPSLTPDIKDPAEAVYRQAVGQLGEKLLGRPLNDIEMEALVEEQKQAVGGFSFERGTAKPKEVGGKDRYYFEDGDVSRVSGILDKIQPFVKDAQAKMLSGIIESGQPLDPDTYADLKRSLQPIPPTRSIKVPAIKARRTKTFTTPRLFSICKTRTHRRSSQA